MKKEFMLQRSLTRGKDLQQLEIKTTLKTAYRLHKVAARRGAGEGLVLAATISTGAGLNC